MVALRRSGMYTKHIQFVELVGEATRIPCIIEAIKTVFEKNELSRTLNSNDCVARGCAI